EQIDVVVGRAEREGLRHQDLFAVGVGEERVREGVRVTRDDDVDLVVQAVHDVRDLRTARQRGRRVGRTVVRALEAALVNGHDDRVDARGLEAGNVRVDGVRLVEEGQPGDARRRDDRGRLLED